MRSDLKKREQITTTIRKDLKDSLEILSKYLRHNNEKKLIKK